MDKKYQDLKTGNIYSFSPIQDVEEIMKTNRNIPKNLTTNIKEKPSENHVWLNGDWININLAPKDYKDPISDIPSYDPAWIVFLFEPLTIISNDNNTFNLTLNEIDSNMYDRRILSKFVTKLQNYDENCNLDILVTYDGSIMLPIDENYNTPEKAISKFNEIAGALFLGGIMIQAIDLKDLNQGGIAEDGKSNFCFLPSNNNNFRHGSMSKAEGIKALYPIYIKTDEFLNAYIFGINYIKKINFSIIYLFTGFHYLHQGKITEALVSLWIIIEQLVNSFLLTMSDIDKKKVFDALNITQAEKIHMKFKVLKEANILSMKEYDFLDKTRDIRNGLFHEGKVPTNETVIELWEVLLNLLEKMTNCKLTKLSSISKSLYYEKNFLPAKTCFQQWKDNTKQLI